MKIATLICVYKNDSSELFERAIDSVLNQNLVGVEHRVYLGVDGPVGDSVEKAMLRRGHLIYKIVRNESSSGLCFTLNKLIDQLEDEDYCFRMDSDDFSYPDRYMKQIQYMNQNKSVAVLGTALREVSSSGSRDVFYPSNSYLCKRNLFFRSPVAHPTVCFRRSVFSSGIKYPLSKSNEDLALWINLDRAGYLFANLDEVLLDFTIQDSFWGRRSYGKAIEEFNLYLNVGRFRKQPFYLYMFPIARLALRMSPSFISKSIYNSKFLRKKQ